jgi:hypothetical protein
MNLKETSPGWGAYQNKKKEIETLKKQLIVQDTNKFGDVITLNKNNIFRNVRTNVNPFRFPNKIKTEELEQNDIDDLKDNVVLTDNKSLKDNDVLTDNKSLKDNVVLTDNKSLKDNDVLTDNKSLKDNDEILNYKKKLKEYNTYITENELTIQNIQKEHDEKINKLKIEYENKILEQKNKYEKWKLIVFGLTELINDFYNNNTSKNDDYSKIEIKNQNNTEEEIKNINENEENIILNINEDNNLTELKTIDEDDEIIVSNDLNKKKGRKISSVSEKRLKEGDTEESCLVEIDDILYEISYKYCTESYMCYGGQIFMTNSSIVKHKGNIIVFTFDGKYFIFYINNKKIQISYKRPRTNGIKNVFNSDTIIRHKAINEEHTWYERDEKGRQCHGKNGNVCITFHEYCIYVKSKNKIFRCDKNGKYKDEDEYKTLSPFIIDNYKKYVPYYVRQQVNQYEHLEYFCKADNCFKSFDEIRHDSKIN